MALEVLKSKSEILAARRTLRKMGISCLDSPSRRILRALRLAGGMGVGDFLKSWDVLKTALFLQQHVDRSAPILDIGAYASEILCVLNKMGYEDLTGIDLDPNIVNMPYAEQIRYEISDFMDSPFPDGSFAAVTAISVIEHGFQRERLLREMSRLLRPGGFFIASFDYWPEKIHTAETRLFGLEWKIFSKDEVVDLVGASTSCGLVPCGGLRYEVERRVIHWNGKDYTFGWLALQKKK